MIFSVQEIIAEITKNYIKVITKKLKQITSKEHIKKIIEEAGKI